MDEQQARVEVQIEEKQIQHELHMVERQHELELVKMAEKDKKQIVDRMTKIENLD